MLISLTSLLSGAVLQGNYFMVKLKQSIKSITGMCCFGDRKYKYMGFCLILNHAITRKPNLLFANQSIRQASYFEIYSFRSTAAKDIVWTIAVPKFATTFPQFLFLFK